MEIESAEPVRNRSDVASFSILHSERKDSQKIVWKISPRIGQFERH